MQLAGCLLNCFNPSLVYYQGKRLLFYRYTPQHSENYTRIAFVELGSNFQPVSRHHPVQLPKVSDRIVTFDDPRAFVWRNELWLMHIQAAYTPQQTWSTAIILNRVDLVGEVTQTHVPAYSRNINYAVAEAPPAFEKNWTPLVIENELYIVYEINPLTAIKFQPEQQTWTPVCHKFWTSPYQTYLSGGTPLIPWHGSEYIGLFHTYVKSPDQQSRLYSMGFYTLDISQWRVTRISLEPVLTAWENECKDIRLGGFWRLFRRKRKKNPLLLVVFPCGIIDCGETWAVSFGWNDCRSYIEIYEKNTVIQSLAAVI